MELQQRFDRITDYLAECFSGGNTSVSKLDVIDDNGTVLGDEVSSVLAGIRRKGIEIGVDHEAVEALDTFSAAWSQGYEMASAHDLVTDTETVQDLLFDYVDSRQATTTVSPTP